MTESRKTKNKTKFQQQKAKNRKLKADNRKLTANSQNQFFFSLTTRNLKGGLSEASIKEFNTFLSFPKKVLGLVVSLELFGSLKTNLIFNFPLGLSTIKLNDVI